jgi:hypothetical protein
MINETIWLFAKPIIESMLRVKDPGRQNPFWCLQSRELLNGYVDKLLKVLVKISDFLDAGLQASETAKTLFLHPS